MKIFKLTIGIDCEPYDRRCDFAGGISETRYIVAETMENAQIITDKYLNENYDDIEYRLEDFEDFGETMLESGNNLYEDPDYSLDG